MSQKRGVVTGRKVFIRVCMTLMMFAVSFAASLLLPRSASALSLPLLDKTTGLATQTLHGTTNALLPSPASQSNTTTDKSSPTNATPAADATDSPAKSVVAPHVVNQASEPAVQSGVSLATLAPLDTVWLTKPVTATTTSARYASLDVDQPGHTSIADSDAVLQPTERGWSLLGVLWYWWLLGLAAAGLSVFTLVRRAAITRISL